MKRIVIIIISVFALIPGMCLSQWKITQNLNTPIRTIKFLDGQGLPNVGFCGDTKLFRTSDRGKSWKLVLDIPQGSFSDITFSSKSDGWAICFDGFVYRTLDTGKTWKKLLNLPAGGYTAIYHNPANGFLFISKWANAAIYSSNRGSTWGTFAQSNLNGYAFCDSSHGLVTDLESSHYTTADGGRNWVRKNFSLEIWQPLAIPGTSTIIAVSEERGMTLRSDDYGNSWDTVMQSHRSLPFSGMVLGSLNALYAPTRQSGFYRSTDQGVTWVSICGPSMNTDTRFFEANDSIFVGDEDGNVWLNPSAAPASDQKLIVQPISTDIVSNGCDTSYIKVAVSTIGCPRRMVDFKFVGFISFGGLSMKQRYATSIPDTITIPFVATENDSGCLLIKIKDYISEFDTCIPIKITVVPTIIREQLSFTSINTTRPVCNGLDTILRIWASCRRPSVTNVQVKNGDIIATPIGEQLPATIGSDDTLYISVRSRRSNGVIIDTIILSINDGLLNKKVLVPVNVVFTGKPRLSFLSDTINVTECDSFSGRITMSNPICDEIFFENISSQSADLFVTSSVKPGYPLKDTRLISFGVSGKIMGVGSHTRSVKIVYKLNGITYDTTLAVTISVKPNNDNKLSLSTSHANLGRVSTCSTKVFPITITNVFCKQVDIEDVRLSSSGNWFMLDTSSLVHTLYSGATSDIALEFSPQSAGVFRDSIVISYSIEGKIFNTSISVIGEGFNAGAVTISSGSKLSLSTSHADLGRVSTCSAKVFPITITNVLCKQVDIEDVRLSSSGNWFMLDTSSLVHTLYSGTTSDIALEFTPRSIGVFRDSIVISYSLEGKIFDTSISVVGEGSNVEEITVSKRNVDFATKYTCSTSTDTLRVVNIGCDSATVIIDTKFSSNIVSSSLTSGAIKIPPSDSVNIVLTLSSTSAGTENGKLSVLQLLTSGQVDTSDVSISASIVPGPLQYTIADAISLGEIPVCTGKDTILWVRNESLCDTLLISSFDTSGSNDFSVRVNSFLIPPNDSASIHISARPLTLGNSLVHVTYILTSGVNRAEDTLTMTMLGIPSKDVFSVGADTINFGVRELCNPVDTTVTIINLTCDVVTLDSILLSGSGFTCNQLSAPLSIAPNSTIVLPITSLTDTSLGNILSLESLVLKSGNYFKKIILVRGYQYPKQYTVSLVHNDTVSSGDIIDVGIQLSTEDISQVRSISFNVRTNSEMLELVSQDSRNQITIQGDKITLSNANGLEADINGVVGWLHYRTFLTKDTIANYYISDQSISPISGYISCPQSWLPQSSTYVYSFQCGERYIQKLLQGLPVSIVSTYPNPTKEIMNIQLSKDIDGSVQYEITQVSGGSIISSGDPKIAGSKISFPVNDLPSGRYQLVLITKYGRLSAPFVVSR